MKAKNLISAAEAILFAAAEPLEAEKIAEVLEISVLDTEKILEN